MSDDYGLRSAAEKVRTWTRQRDALIRAMRADGFSLRAIAAQAGMTHAGIAKIVKRDG